MRTLLLRLAPLALFGGAATLYQACGSVPDDSGLGEFPVGGVIRGNVVYDGPAPCTQNGHVVGNAILLVFDRRNPPPPSGLGNTAINVGVVNGDLLFANVPRVQGATKVCPASGSGNISATAPYTIAPMAAGSYIIQAFYDYTGDFLPTFKFRQLPEATDIGGGYIDLDDAQKLVQNINGPTATLADGGRVNPLEPQAANPSYQPVFLPIDIGTVTAPPPPGSLRGVPSFALPPTGYVADNVTVTIASNLGFARPYFYPEGLNPANTVVNDVGTGAVTGTIDPSNFPPNVPNGPTSIVSNGASTTLPTAPVKTPGNPSGTPSYVPVLSFPQDLAVYALPDPSQFNAVPYFQASFPQLVIHWFGDGADAFSKAEQVDAVAAPFNMQLLDPAPAGAPIGGNGGLFDFHDQTDTATEAEYTIPEGLVPTLWPLVVLSKLVDDPNHTTDPQSLTPQGTDLTQPIVIIQAITLSQDSLINTVQVNPPTNEPTAANLYPHVTAMLRPAALCLDPRHPDLGGTVVTPYETGPFPPKDTLDTGNGTIFNPAIVSNPQLTSLVKQNGTGAVYGCLPTGRYAVNVVYPSGQAWTTPNEIGSCAAGEGATNVTNDPGTCAKPRPVLRSQGTRAVVEITPTTNPNNCKGPTINAIVGDGGVGKGPNAPSSTTPGDPVPQVPAACTTLPPGP